jgi:poly-gamma-glutamate synthesis protein (capsule biosynthesis protein)
VKAAFFREAVKAGVTIVWGQHPHVLQPWEIDTVDGLPRLIINSNGNFISGQISEIDPKSPSVPRTYTGDSAIFHVQVSRRDEKTSVVSVYPELVSNFKTTDGQMIIAPLDQLVRDQLSPVWHDYYAYRLKTIRALTRGTVVGADGKSLPAIGSSEFAAWSAAPVQ